MADFYDIGVHVESREGGIDCSPADAVVREYLMDMYHLCLGMKSLDMAMPTLYLMEKCLRKNATKDPRLLSLPSQVEEHFAKVNEPQPSTKFEGCSFYNEDKSGAKVGQMFMDNHGNINNKEKE